MGSRALTKRFLLAVVAMLSFIAAGSAQSANSWVNPQNTARQAVGVAGLTWDSTLATYATNWAQYQALSHNCDLEHSGGPYGENIFWASWNSSPNDAVQSWVDEKQYYNYARNSCASGQVCGHYTQVVWRNTLRVGCGQASCPQGGTFVVCNYNPPGNYAGQRPY